VDVVGLTDPGPEQASGAGQAGRGQVAAALARSALSAGLLVVGYYLAPLEGRLGPVAWLWFTLALVGFALVGVRQVRAITVSKTPRLRAVEAVAVALPLLLIVFAATYKLLDGSDPGSFNESLTRTDALYFTVTVFTTVGFGDIVPVTETARIITTIQMVTGLIVVGALARVVVGAIEIGMRRRSGRGGGGETGPSPTRGE
jgi:hypothetical protein